MNSLVKQVKLGDITFGIPGDIELLNSPWGFYAFLGIPRDVSPEEIKRAYKQLSLKFHPDRGGDPESFRNLARVVETLLDDGGELGEEHSQRRHYDEISSLDSYFDEFIQYEDERTKKLSEIMLIQMQGERKEAETELEIAKEFPRFAELKEQLNGTISLGERKKIVEQMNDIAAEAAGFTPEMQEQVDRVIKESRERFAAEQRSFARSFQESPGDYFPKILDVFYIGGGNVTFGQNRGSMQLGLVAHENKAHILELILGGYCHIVGFSQVHFKSEQADVSITDPNVEGIFHVLKGSVRLDFDKSSYGSVIRARAPNVRVIKGFARRGNLYVPERFATGNWWQKKPALDIAVREGCISLDLRSPDFSSRSELVPGLESLLEGHLKKNLNNIIDNNLCRIYDDDITKKY